MSMWTPLDFAASEGHTEIVKFLLSEDVPVNPADKEGVSPCFCTFSINYILYIYIIIPHRMSLGDSELRWQF